MIEEVDEDSDDDGDGGGGGAADPFLAQLEKERAMAALSEAQRSEKNEHLGDASTVNGRFVDPQAAQESNELLASLAKMGNVAKAAGAPTPPSKPKPPAAEAAAAAEAAPATVAAVLSGPFVACSAFAGKRGGYVFRSGAQGLGYYADAAQQAAPQAGGAAMRKVAIEEVDGD